MYLARLCAMLTASSPAAAAGEIIPQAACSRYGLQIGAFSAPFVRVRILTGWAAVGMFLPCARILSWLHGCAC